MVGVLAGTLEPPATTQWLDHITLHTQSFKASLTVAELSFYSKEEREKILNIYKNQQVIWVESINCLTLNLEIVDVELAQPFLTSWFSASSRKDSQSGFQNVP